MNQRSAIIELKNISKSFGSLWALNDISLDLPEQGIIGLFGRNGAGKTTLLNIITSRIFPDRGNVTFIPNHISPHSQAALEKTCYMQEKEFFPGRYRISKILTNAEMFFPGFDRNYAESLSSEFGLDLHMKYEHLSLGYRSVLRIVLGLSSRAPITIFDEPVQGMDAHARDLFYRELVESYSSLPRLFIVSTHFIEESADLFNEAIIIKNGSVIRKDSVENILAGAYYVSGKKENVDSYLKDRKVISTETVNVLKTALVEGDFEGEKPLPGLKKFPVTMQKLFIHLTDVEEK